MELERRGNFIMKIGGIVLALGVFKFVFSVTSWSSAPWHCLIYADRDCDTYASGYWPTLVYIGLAALAAGFAVYQYGTRGGKFF